MTIKEKIKNIIREDRGSTLITVIVAIGFITILTAIILGSSLTNFRMKAIDRRAKEDFYHSEKALNDIYTGIGQAVAEIAANAYDSAFSHVGATVKGKSAGTFEDVSTAQKAEKYYRKKFFTDLDEWLTANAKAGTFQTYIVDEPEKESYVTGVGAYTIEDISETVVPAAKFDTDAVCARIKDISVVTTDTKKDIKSEVVTDIVISIPMLSFFESNVDVFDYALIANKGIDINGDLTVEDGNMYAGIDTPADAVNGIKINTGNTTFLGHYLVSKGDITVGSDGNTAMLKVGDASSRTTSNIWFDSITTDEKATAPKIDITGNAFALNDLELNALESEATFHGAYYGYDRGYFAHSDPEAPGAPTDTMLIDSGKEHSDSSAIIINGDRCKLDMSGLSTFILMGKAYIEAEGNEISTAEAMALRTNQQLYLVPADFLNCANPVSGTKNDADWGVNIPTDWFGYKYLLKSGGTPVIQTITVGDTEENKVSYAFLTFDDSSSAKFDLEHLGGKKDTKARNAYIFEIMNGVDSGPQPTQSQLKERISNSLANYDSFRLRECVVDNSGDANIYTVNAIANYMIPDDYAATTEKNGIRVGTADVTPVSNTAAWDRYMTYPQNLFRRYKWLCNMLIANEDIPLSKEVPDVEKVATADRVARKIDEDVWARGTQYPYRYYINTPATVSSYVAGEAKLPKASFGECIYSTSDCSISGDFSGVLISEGNIVVGHNVDINGTLIAKGKIIFNGENTVKSDRALIQKRINKELDIIKENGKRCCDYVTSYLDDGSGQLLYRGLTAESLRAKADDERTNYKEYIYFENWKKGGRN